MRLLILALLLGIAPAQAAVRVRALTAGPAEVVVALDGAATAKVLALDTPRRLVVDLAGVDAPRLAAAGSGVAGAAVTAARIGQFDAATARLVIDLSRPMRVGTALVQNDGRLSLTLVPVGAAAFSAAVKQGRRPLALTGKGTAVPLFVPRRDVVEAGEPGGPVVGPDFDLPDGIFGAKAKPVAPPPAPVAETPAAPAPPPRSGGRKPLVVIDAGHGGKDVGAIALTGRYEKDATLAIARAVARALEGSGKVRVKLTRADDRFIPLGGRVAIARAARADLFISIHADSAPNVLARGASVYTLSDTASDAVAARLAARENKADIIGGVNLGVEAPEVGDVMIALLRRSTLNTAIAFAETLQAELDDRIAFRGEFHHFAGFLVLKAADVPSVLLESGYVSNPVDAAFLFSKRGQRTIGEGVARAIEKHLGRR